MAMSPNIDDREINKFRQGVGDTTRVAVDIESTVPFSISGSLLSDVSFDDIQASYPSNTVEIYTYYLATVLVATIEVTYLDKTKRVFIRARRV